MSTQQSGRLRRLSAFAAATALALGGLAVTATPAAAAEETIDNATFTWGLNGYAQQGIFGPWNFKDFTGDANQLIGSVTTGAANPQSEYVVEPTPATSFPTALAGKTPNAVKFTGGDGTVDRVTGAADLTWEGSYTVNAYPAQYNAPNEIYSDPHLTVEADGSGELTVDFTIGAGIDMGGTPFEAKDFGRLKIATFDAGSLSAKSFRGYRVTPDYQGVEMTPAFGAQDRSCTTAGGATGWWGSWPTDFVNALGSHASGQSVQAHFYSSGCSGAQDKKPPLPFDVKFPTTQGSVEISQSAFNPQGTQTVTVTGSGFDPDYAAGNAQPPFAGKSSGVYIAFGRFQDIWDPAAGAPSGNRALADDTANRNGVSVKWAVPASSFPGAPAQDPNAPSYTQLNADGSFSTTLQIDKSWISAASGNWGIYTYRGGNPAVTEYATFTPISFLKPSTTVATGLPAEAAYGDELTANVTVEGEDEPPTGTVAAFDGENKLAEGDLVDGAVALDLPTDLPAGTHDVTFTYEGDDDYAESTSDVHELTITKSSSSTVVTTVPTSSPYGAVRTAKVTVSGVSPTGTVTAKIGSATVGSGAVNASGVASIALSRTIKVGTQSIVYSYAGDAGHEPSTASKALKVVAAKVKITRGSIKKPTTKKSGKTSVAVTSTTGGPAVRGKVTVSFSKKGKKTVKTTKTLSTSGKAAITIPKLAKGTWKVSVKYLGSTNHLRTATISSGTFKVTR